MEPQPTISLCSVYQYWCTPHTPACTLSMPVAITCIEIIEFLLGNRAIVCSGLKLIVVSTIEQYVLSILYT